MSSSLHNFLFAEEQNTGIFAGDNVQKAASRAFSTATASCLLLASKRQCRSQRGGWQASGWGDLVCRGGTLAAGQLKSMTDSSNGAPRGTQEPF